MKIKKMMSMRFCLSLGAALTVASVLVANRGGPAPNLEGPGVVYVYFASECPVAGVAQNCQETPRGSRPSFETMEACMAHADVELAATRNPRIMASCLKIRES